MTSSPPRLRIRALLAAFLLGVPVAASLGGCAYSPPLSAADRVTLDDCRSNADRVYNAQNRAELSERDSRDTPFSGSAQPGTESDGLAARYSHERMVDSCVHRGNFDPNAAN